MTANQATSRPVFDDEVNQIWKQVEERVIQMAGGDRSKIIPNLDIESVLDCLDRAQASDKKSAEKFSIIRNIFNRSLQCIQTVGGIVATGASYAFAPAGTCYSALTFVIQAWHGYEGIFESLASLLEKCTEFLDRLGYYAQFGMDSKLTKVACQHLQVFVEICDRSLNLRKKRNKLTAFMKQLFLNDDGVKDLLGGMERLIDKERGLVAAQTWRSSNEAAQNSKDGLALTRRLHDSMVEDVKQAKLEKEIQQWKLSVIDAMENDAKIVTDPDTKPQWETTWMRLKSGIIEGSGKWLFQDPRFNAWVDNSESSTPILGLQGYDGTGKTMLVSNVVLHLHKMNTIGSTGSQIVVAHNLLDTDPKSTANEAYMLAITRSLICQMAMSDTSFLRYAASKCESEKYFESPLEIWRQILFENENFPLINSTFFIIMDGIGKDVQAYLDLFQRLSSGSFAPKIRILLAADQETFDNIEKARTLKVSKFVLGQPNIQDIELLIRHRMDNMDMLQDETRPEIPEMREKILNTLRDSAGGDYYKLNGILDNISKTDDVDEINSYLKNAGRARLEQIEADIKKMNETRTPKEIAEINEIILWLNTSFMKMEPYEMEAALALRGSNASLMSLESKIKTKYSIFQIDYRNWVEYKLDEVPDKIPTKSLDAAHGGSADQHGEIQAGEMKMLKHYLSIVCPKELYERVGFDEFLDVKMVGKRSYIFQDPNNAQMELVLRCLKCLTEPRSQKTEALYDYSRDYLLEHMEMVDLSMADRALKAEAGEKLVKLFTDPFAIVSLLDFRDNPSPLQLTDHPRFTLNSFSERAWIQEDSGVLVLKRWFQDTAIIMNVKSHPMILSFNDPNSNKFATIFEVGMKESAKLLFQVGGGDRGKGAAFTFLCIMILRTRLSSPKATDSENNTPDLLEAYWPGYELFQAVEDWSQTALEIGEKDANWEFHATELLHLYTTDGNIPKCKVEERARRVLELDPGCWKASHILSQTINSDSGSTEILEGLVEDLINDEKVRGSSENVSHLIKIMFDLGENLFSKPGRQDEAIRVYSTILDVDRSYSVTGDFLSVLEAYMRDGRRDAIIAFFGKLLEGPEDRNDAGEFIEGMIWEEIWGFPDVLSYALESAKPALCDILFNKAKAACNDDSDHLFLVRVTQGQVLEHLGRLEEARKTLESILDDAPGDKKLGLVYELLLPLWEKLTGAADIDPAEAAMLNRKVEEIYLNLESEIINNDDSAMAFGKYYYRRGDRTRAKKALLAQARQALETLADDVPQNDLNGPYETLRNVFAVMHDISNLAVIVELRYQATKTEFENYCRRKATWDKNQEALGNGKSSAGDSEQNEEDRRIDNIEGGSDVQPGELEDDVTSEPEAPIEYDILCGGDWSHRFKNAHGLWHCLTQLGRVRFDEQCYQRLLDGTLVHESCHKDHEFVKMPERDDRMLDALPEGHVMLGEMVISIDQWKEEIKLKYIDFE